MFERFTDRARRSIVLAQEATRELGADAIRSEHILLGLMKDPEGVAAKALGLLGVDDRKVAASLKADTETARNAQGHIPFSASAKSVLEQSLRESVRLGHHYIGTEHILLGIAGQPDSEAHRILLTLGAEPPAIIDAVTKFLPPTSDPFPPSASA